MSNIITTDADCLLGTPGYTDEGIYIWQNNARRLIADGLLVHPDITSLLGYTEQLDQWGLVRCTVTVDDLTGPDGAPTMDKLVAASDVGDPSSHYSQLAATVADSTEYWFSTVFRADELTQVEMRAALPSGNQRVQFDLSSGEVHGEIGGAVGVIEQIESADASGFAKYKAWCKVTTGVGDVGSRFFGLYLMSGWATAFAGDDSSGLYATGMQVVAGYDHGVYIPNSGSGSALAPAPNYRLTQDAFIRHQQGRLAIDMEFQVLEATGDVPLWCAYDVANALNCILVDQGGGSYKIGCARGGDSSAAAIVEGNDLRLVSMIYADESAHLVLVDRTAGVVLLDEWLTGTGYTGFEIDHFKLGCNASESQHGWIVIRKVREAA